MNSDSVFRTALDFFLEMEESQVYDRQVVVGMLCQDQDFELNAEDLLSVLKQAKIIPIGVDIVE